MPRSPLPALPQRAQRNSALYRSLTRTLREYNRRLLGVVRERGFPEFQPSFPTLLSNLDLAGTPIGVLARRGGVTRQAAGQLLREIERCGFATRSLSPDDARITIVQFTPLGKRLLTTIVEAVLEIEGEYARLLQAGEFTRVRAGLRTIADAIDPEGSFGVGDLPELTKRKR